MQTANLSGKRLLLVTDFKLSGGTETYFEQLIDFYSKEDVDLTLLFYPSVTKPQLAEKNALFPIIFTRLEIDHLYGDMETKLGIFAKILRELNFFRLRRACRKRIMTHEFDLVIVSTGRLGHGLETLAFHPNSLYFVHTYPHSRLSKILAKHVYRRRIPKNCRLISVSKYASTEIEQSLDFRKSEISVPYIYSTAGPVVDPTERPTNYKRNIVLTLGAVEDYKNPMFVVELAKYSKNASGAEDLRFIWGGSGSLLDEMRRHASRFKLDNLHFIGEQESVDKLLRESFVYLQPSLVESLGLAALDAMRNGIPCIVSNVGGLPEIVADGISGSVVSSWETWDWLERIIEIRNNQDLRMRFQAGATQNYSVKFSPDRWENNVRQLHLEAIDMGK